MATERVPESLIKRGAEYNSLVPQLVCYGEGCAESCVFVHVAAPLPTTHTADVSHSWREGAGT